MPSEKTVKDWSGRYAEGSNEFKGRELPQEYALAGKDGWLGQIQPISFYNFLPNVVL